MQSHSSIGALSKSPSSSFNDKSNIRDSFNNKGQFKNFNLPNAPSSHSHSHSNSKANSIYTQSQADQLDQAENARRAHFLNACQKFDLNNDGRLDIWEIRKFTKFINLNINEQQIDQITDCINSTVDGEISYEDLLNIILKSSNGETEEERETLEAYVALGGSIDKTGSVDADRIKKVIADFGLTINIDELLDLLDTDKSGLIEFDEFRCLFDEEYFFGLENLNSSNLQSISNLLVAPKTFDDEPQLQPHNHSQPLSNTIVNPPIHIPIPLPKASNSKSISHNPDNSSHPDPGNIDYRSNEPRSNEAPPKKVSSITIPRFGSNDAFVPSFNSSPLPPVSSNNTSPEILNKNNSKQVLASVPQQSFVPRPPNVPKQAAAQASQGRLAGV